MLEPLPASVTTVGPATTDPGGRGAPRPLVALDLPPAGPRPEPCGGGPTFARALIDPWPPRAPPNGSGATARPARQARR